MSCITKSYGNLRGINSKLALSQNIQYVLIKSGATIKVAPRLIYTDSDLGQESVNPCQHIRSVHSEGIANARAIGIGHIRVDCQNSIRVRKQIGSTRVAETSTA